MCSFHCGWVTMVIKFAIYIRAKQGIFGSQHEFTYVSILEIKSDSYFWYVVVFMFCCVIDFCFIFIVIFFFFFFFCMALAGSLCTVELIGEEQGEEGRMEGGGGGGGGGGVVSSLQIVSSLQSHKNMISTEARVYLIFFFFLQSNCMINKNVSFDFSEKNAEFDEKFVWALFLILFTLLLRRKKSV